MGRSQSCVDVTGRLALTTAGHGRRARSVVDTPSCSERAGFGEGIVKRLRSDGAKVLIVDMNAELGQAKATEHGCTFEAADVSKRDSWERILARVDQEYGRLDIICASSLDRNAEMRRQQRRLDVSRQGLADRHGHRVRSCLRRQLPSLLPFHQRLRALSAKAGLGRSLHHHFIGASALSSAD